MYSGFTGGVQLVYRRCTVGLQEVYSGFTGGVQLVYRRCTVGLQEVYSGFTGGVQCVYTVFPVQKFGLPPNDHKSSLLHNGLTFTVLLPKGNSSALVWNNLLTSECLSFIRALNSIHSCLRNHFLISSLNEKFQNWNTHQHVHACMSSIHIHLYDTYVHKHILHVTIVIVKTHIRTFHSMPV